ncbi:hypothetical protein QJS04_geneDACA006020 [Acorus gramineus]|uniref:Peptide N-acetyl-beta-D-glucosaminyl asparaginase amidase A N-terminal domain-containing protein n=1 Tax=Acorus gramineus TaxID=55184 RepID=A0AAV9B0M5_ACOGR|nr:hypothetical protein QJS04_geneDACA006020 [Acorus gramineus]
MITKSPLFCLLLIILFYTRISECTLTNHTPSSPQHLLRTSPKSNGHNSTTELLELTLPIPSNGPNCSITLLSHDFANTVGSPPTTVPFSPPSDACPDLLRWTRAVLLFSASSVGDQYDRIAAVWLGGVELLRTSTAEPTESGVRWTVRKDVTRYASLFRPNTGPPANLSVMLENIVNDVYTGVYSVNVSLVLYEDEKSRVSEAADLVIPISESDGDGGSWFRISGSETRAKAVELPRNAYKAVLEIYASPHSDDEFWYSNPPDEYIEANGLRTGRGGGAFREIVATVDGAVVGSVVPFPVVYTGGIVPLFWSAVVGIGAFDVPSYELDLTPFVGAIADGGAHAFGLGVTDAEPYWLVDANLHVWLDPGSSVVEAKIVEYRAPYASIDRESEFVGLDGKFEIEAERRLVFAGWANSSVLGNVTTIIQHKFKFKSKIKIDREGNHKQTKMEHKSEARIRVKTGLGKSVSMMKRKRSYPLTIETETLPESDKTRYLSRTNLSHTMLASHKRSSSVMGRGLVASISNEQVSNGWMRVEDHSVLEGAATTRQSLRYVGEEVGDCYYREVSATDEGEIVRDYSSDACVFAY